MDGRTDDGETFKSQFEVSENYNTEVENAAQDCVLDGGGDWRFKSPEVDRECSAAVRCEYNVSHTRQDVCCKDERRILARDFQDRKLLLLCVTFCQVRWRNNGVMRHDNHIDRYSMDSSRLRR